MGRDITVNPVGRMYYAASTMICTPASLAQEVGLGLGAQAGEVKLRQVVSRGHVQEFDTSRKDTHWGRRKLKRDE